MSNANDAPEGSVLRPTEFAVAADLDGGFTLYAPAEMPNIPMPENVRVLTAFALRLSDPEFVEEMLEYLDRAPTECPPDCPRCGGGESRTLN